MKRYKSDDPSLNFYSFVVYPPRKMLSVLRSYFKHLITIILVIDTPSKSTLPPKSLKINDNLLKKDLFSINDINP